MTKGSQTMSSRRKKVDPFDFTFEDKNYVIKQPYNAQPATLILSDGKILQVRTWAFLPTEPIDPQVSTFDPNTQPAAELVKVKKGAFLAELVEKTQQEAK
jgi:hypothetical protein